MVIKALVSGAIAATVSEVAKRYPGFGGLIASRPMFLLIPALLTRGVGSGPRWAPVAS